MQYMKPSAAQEITTGIFKTIIKQGLRHNIMLLTGIHQLKICEEELNLSKFATQRTQRNSFSRFYIMKYQIICTNLCYYIDSWQNYIPLKQWYGNFSTLNLIKFQYLGLRFWRLIDAQFFFFSWKVSVRKIKKKTPLLCITQLRCKKLQSLYGTAWTQLCFGIAKHSLAATLVPGARAHWGVIQIWPHYTASIKQFIHVDPCRTNYLWEGRAAAEKGQEKPGNTLPHRI